MPHSDKIIQGGALEMNDKTREEMTKEIELRKKFTKCIIKNTTKHYPIVEK